MNYYLRFGLEFNPFVKNSKDIVIETNDYIQVKNRLNYLVENKGFGLLTGEPGRGKTTAVRHWAKELSNDRFAVIYTSLATLTLTEFYRHLAESLGLEARSRKPDNYRLIQAEINRFSLDKRITPVFIIDEANHINGKILGDLKMLFNFEMDSRDRAIVLLVGNPTINNTLRLKVNEALKQRITINYHIGNLPKEDSRIYISTKLQSAGGALSVFDESAIEAITNASNGIPRIINKICDMCLIIANEKKVERIDSETVMMAVNEVELR